MKTRFLGIDGLRGIIKKNGWKINSMSEGNPRDVIFSLKKVNVKL
jgi:hypothetical protein